MNQIMIDSCFIRACQAQIVFLLGQIVLYFGCEFFQKNPHDVLTEVDRFIPFLPVTAVIYVLWFPMILLLPIYLVFTDPGVYVVYMTAATVEDIVSVICYLIYPTSFKRPDLPDTWDGRLMKMVYKGSFRGYNCAPSLHCSSCDLILMCLILCHGMPPAVRLISAVIAVGIILTTMTTKQHAVIDVLTAIPVAIISLLIGLRFPATWLGAWIIG